MRSLYLQPRGAGAGCVPKDSADREITGGACALPIAIERGETATKISRTDLMAVAGEILDEFGLDHVKANRRIYSKPRQGYVCCRLLVI